jgi:hypothetical protein
MYVRGGMESWGKSVLSVELALLLSFEVVLVCMYGAFVCCKAYSYGYE